MRGKGMPLKDIVIEFLGTDAPTDEDWNAKIPELLARNDTLETENQGFKEQVGDLNTQIKGLEALKEKAEIGDKYLADTRERAKVAYLKLKGENAPEGMLKTIESSDLQQAQALAGEFEAEVEKKFPLKCEACGAVGQFSRRSSVEEPDEEPGQGDSDDDCYKIRNKKEE
jgi:hypothetical protein